MTTIITTKDGFYSDTIATRGNLISDDDCKKTFKYKKCAVAITGMFNNLSVIAKKIIDGEEFDNFENVSGDLFIRKSGCNLIECHYFDEGKYERYYVSEDNCYGSGALLAYAALDMGATPEEAIKAAAKRDNCTNDKVIKVLFEDLDKEDL